MTIRDKLWISFRHMKSGIIGAVLVVLAIAIGVALSASTTSFIRLFNKQTDELLNNPVYREIVVESLGGHQTQLSLPVVEINGEQKRRENLDMKDLELVKQSVSSIAYAYLASPSRFISSSFILEQFDDRAGGIRPPAQAMNMGRGRAPAGEQVQDEEKNPDESRTAEKEKPAEKEKEDGLAESSEKEKKDTGRKEEKEKKEKEQNEKEKEFFEEQMKLFTDVKESLSKESGISEIAEDQFRGVFISSEFFQAYNLSVQEGSLFTDEDFSSGNRVMVLGERLAERLFPDSEALGKRISVNMQTFTIIGILEDTEIIEPIGKNSLNNVAFTPNRLDAKHTSRFERMGVQSLRFAVNDSSNVEAALEQVTAYFDSEYPMANLQITAAVDQMKNEHDKQTRVLVVLVFISVIGLFIACINMFNLMLIRVIKHIKSIGIMRALGFTRTDIFNQFLYETLVMAFAGLVIGLSISPLVYKLLQTALVSNFSQGAGADFIYLLIGAAAAFLISLLFGLYPAFMARQSDTSSALRSE